MTLIARDSTDPFAIPLDGLSSAWGYADGLYVWSSEGWARFPASVVSLSIATNPLSQADILDVERFDARPADCPGWSDRFERPRRRRPTLYSARGTDALGRVDWSTIQAILDAMAGRPFDWIMATLDGTADFTGSPKVPVAVQVRDVGGLYNESIILDPSWVQGRSSGMILVTDPAGAGHILFDDGTLLSAGLDAATTAAQFQAAGLGSTGQLDQDTWDKLVANDKAVRGARTQASFLPHWHHLPGPTDSGSPNPPAV